MEWIKANYDRLLLGILGIIALVLGVLLLMKIIGFKQHFPHRPEPVERSDFGTDDASKRLELAKARLVEPAVFKPPVFDGKPASLFVSAPVLKMASGEVIPILDPKAKQVRPPIDNEWLFRYDLDVRRTDIAEVDSDGDDFPNQDEFLADPKTNPKDKNSHPPNYLKLAYTEVIEDPLTLRFPIYNSDNEVTIQRSEPVAKKFNSLLKVGESFPSEKGSKEMRFKLVKVEKRDIKTGGVTDIKEVAIIEDLLIKRPKNIEIVIRESVALPSLRAKITCTLGAPEEKIVSEGEEFSFAVNPEQKYTVEKITKEEVTLETTDAEGKKVKVILKIKP